MTVHVIRQREHLAMAAIFGGHKRGIITYAGSVETRDYSHKPALGAIYKPTDFTEFRRPVGIRRSADGGNQRIPLR